jgi:acylphosphatase
MEHDERRNLRVIGKVQGVFYRATAKEKADELGLTGWVRNCVDGSVEAIIEGPSSRLDAFEAWARRGPPAARVEHVEVRVESPHGNLDGFTVRR